MTWKYKLTDNGNLSVYDHNDDHVTTEMNDGSGFDLPGSVLEVMGGELDSRGWDLSDAWVQEAVKTALIEDIEEQSSE